MKNERLYHAIKVNNFIKFKQILLKEIIPIQEDKKNNVTKIDDEIAAGLTSLQAAVKYGRLVMVQYLVEQGADVNKTDHGRLLYAMAMDRGYIFIAYFLKFCGAAPDSELAVNVSLEEVQERSEEKQYGTHSQSLVCLRSALVSAVNNQGTRTLSLLIQFIQREKLYDLIRPTFDALSDLATAQGNHAVVTILKFAGATMMTDSQRRYLVQQQQDNIYRVSELGSEENRLYYDLVAAKNLSVITESGLEPTSFYQVLNYAYNQQDYVTLVALIPQIAKHPSFVEELFQQQNFGLLNLLLFLGGNPQNYLQALLENYAQTQEKTSDSKHNTIEEKYSTVSVFSEDNITNLINSLTNFNGGFSGFLQNLLLDNYYRREYSTFRALLNLLLSCLPVKKGQQKTVEHLPEALQKVITTQFLRFIADVENIDLSGMINNDIPSLSQRVHGFNQNHKITSIQKQRMNSLIKDYAALFSLKYRWDSLTPILSQSKSSSAENMCADAWLLVLGFLSQDERAKISRTSYRINRFARNPSFIEFNSIDLVELYNLQNLIKNCLQEIKVQNRARCIEDIPYGICLLITAGVFFGLWADLIYYEISTAKKVDSLWMQLGHTVPVNFNQTCRQIYPDSCGQSYNTSIAPCWDLMQQLCGEGASNAGAIIIMMIYGLVTLAFIGCVVADCGRLRKSDSMQENRDLQRYSEKAQTKIIQVNERIKLDLNNDIKGTLSRALISTQGEIKALKSKIAVTQTNQKQIIPRNKHGEILISIPPAAASTQPTDKNEEELKTWPSQAEDNLRVRLLGPSPNG